MQVLKDEIRLRIIEAAKYLFLQYGFEKASMNMIANKAGVSKSNLYNYFSSKEQLFYHLTDPAYVQLEAMMDYIFKHDYDTFFNLEEYEAGVSKNIIGLLTQYREEILLLIDCSRGTRFENVKQEFIKRIQEHTMAEMKKINIVMEDEDSFFAHYTATTWVEGLLEIIKHNKSDTWIKNNIKMMVSYYFSGYSHFFGKDK